MDKRHFSDEPTVSEEQIESGNRKEIQKIRLPRALVVCFWLMFYATGWWLMGYWIIPVMIVNHVILPMEARYGLNRYLPAPTERRKVALRSTLFVVLVIFYAITLGILQSHHPEVFRSLINLMQPVVLALKDYFPRALRVGESLYGDRLDYVVHAIVIARLSLIPLLLVWFREMWKCPSWDEYICRWEFVIRQQYLLRLPYSLIFFLFCILALYGFEFLFTPSHHGPKGYFVRALFRVHDNNFFMLGEVILFYTYAILSWFMGMCAATSLARSMMQKLQKLPQKNEN